MRRVALLCFLFSTRRSDVTNVTIVWLLCLMAYCCISLWPNKRQHNNKRNDKDERNSLLEKYTSHFIWKVACERELETEQNCNIMTLTLMAISVVSFSFSRVAQPEARGPSFLLDAGFLYRILSPTGLQINWLPVFTELYKSSIAHSISLEWHVWSPSSGNNCHGVHRSLSSGASVYDCTMGFYLVPYCQPSPPTWFFLITAIRMCHFCCLWNGMFGQVEGQYTTISTFVSYLMPKLFSLKNSSGTI